MEKTVDVYKKSTDLSLQDIITVIGDGDLLHWKLLWFHGTGSLRSMSIPEFEEKVNDSSNGIFVSWKDLVDFSTSIDQTIDVLLIGDKSRENLVRYDSDDIMRRQCLHCIELVDSSYWLLSSNDEKMNKVFEKLH